MLAMVVNDNARMLKKRSVLEFFASFALTGMFRRRSSLLQFA